MTKKLLLALIALMTFCVSGHAQPGFTCANAIPVTSLPFQTTDNTANYGDTVDFTSGTGCANGNYTNGNDVFYSYTAAQTGVINISMLPTAGFSSISVYDGCESIGTACVAAVANSSMAERVIQALDVTAGHTYIFLISTFPFPQTVGYTLSISSGVGQQCQAPVDVQYSSTTDNSVSVTWTEIGTASEWQVAVIPAGSGAPTTGESSFSEIYTVSGLIANETYEIYVRAVCGATTSPWSIPATFSTVCPSPTNLSATSFTDTSAQLSWNVSGGATEWEVLVLPATEPLPANATGTPVGTNSYLVTGLTPHANYKFYVRTFCQTAFGGWSSATFTSVVSQPPLTANNTQFTNAQLVTDVLLNNPCMNVTNITSSTGSNFGSVNGIGYFSNTNPHFPLSSGLVLSTGNIMNIPGPNTTTLSDGNSSWPGDIQLQNIIFAGTGATMDSYNATKLEFDFMTQNEYMSFNFLFASEEYGTFQCAYSDAFAFLLTDLATGVTTNLAVVPNTNVPISVVTIRDTAFNTGCPSQNPDFFDEYYGAGLANASATNLNGQTTEMTASSSILPNHPYHIKLVVADRGDSAYDSAVFIEAGSFAAGPPECTDKIRLIAFIDTNANGIKDSGEVDFTYGSFVYQQNNAGDIHNISSPFGTYTIYDSNPANTYDLSYQVNAEYAPYYSVAATNYSDINIPTGSATLTYYFPITMTTPFNDVSVIVTSGWHPPVAGMDYSNRIIYRNLGVAPTSGTVSFAKDPAVMITGTSEPGATITASGFTYNFSNLMPYETRTMQVNMAVPSIPTVNIDDLLTNSATISAPSADINLTNNASSLTQTVVASYDPNDISESHGGAIQFDQFSQSDYLYYTIHFQNTGTSNAINVRVEDILNSRFDETSIRMVASSHNYVMERVGNHIEWNFNYIQLPGAVQSEEASKGYITYQVRLKPGFAIGDIIPNTASIYFDTNPAIVTNTFNTEFVTQLANAQFDENTVLVYPNPASGNVSVSLQNSSEILQSITIYDLVGKAISKTENISSEVAIVDVSTLSTGIYIIEMTTENQMKLVKKLIIK